MTVSKCVKGRLCPSQRNNIFESKRLAEQSGRRANPRAFLRSYLNADLRGDRLRHFTLLATLPPSSRAMSARRRPVSADFGCAIVISLFEAYRSRCLISSQDFPAFRPYPRVRTNTQDPCNFFPRSANFSSPFFIDGRCALPELLANFWQTGFLMTIPLEGDCENSRLFIEDVNGGPGWT